MNQRLRNICDLSVSSAREFVGLHEYDGRVEDLSVDGVRVGLARLGGPPLDDPLDEAYVSEAFAEGWAHYGEELCLEEGFRSVGRFNAALLDLGSPPLGLMHHALNGRVTSG